MSIQATTRQKQYLRQLGQKEVQGLTKEQASDLIDRLIEEEKRSGRQFPCPYCKQKFGPRPKRTKKCPHCGKTIYHICGKFLTESQVGNLNQNEWFNEERENVKESIRDDWREEQKFRKDFKEKLWVGYLLRIGPNCPHAAHLNGLLVLAEDAKANPDLLPPYDECRHDTCECEYELVSAHEVPRGTRVAEIVGQERKRKAGCLGVLMAAVGLLVWALTRFA
jgi:hypothetical protein